MFKLRTPLIIKIGLNQWVSNWRRTRRLRRELREINHKYVPLFNNAKSNSEAKALHDEYNAETDEILSELRSLSTQELTKQSAKFGLEMPSYADSESWTDGKGWRVLGDGSYTPYKVLSISGEAKLTGQISKARLEYWRSWVQIVSQIATVTIALLALGISILALYLQLSGEPSIPP